MDVGGIQNAVTTVQKLFCPLKTAGILHPLIWEYARGVSKRVYMDEDIWNGKIECLSVLSQRRTV